MTISQALRTGAVVYDRAGETAGKRGDSRRLEELLGKAASAAEGSDPARRP